MDLSRLSIPQRISAVSMVVVALAAFLPWVSIFGISVRGTEGDGVITLLASVGGVVTLAATSGVLRPAGEPGRISQIVLVVLAAVVALVGLLDMNGAAAIGLYLTLFGGLAWLAGAIWQLVATRPAAPDVA